MKQEKRIYVTGHTGMVGSSIVRKLEEQGYSHIIKRTHQELDLKDSAAVEQFFKEERPDYIFDAAARVGGIQANQERMADFLMDNLMIQSNLFLNAKKYQVEKLLFLGSACIYPKECQQPIKEEYLLSGKLEPTNEGYAIAKIVGLKACHYFNKQYGTNFISAMPVNVYGENDNFNIESSHVIPALIRRFHEAKQSNKEEIVVWGTGKATREFLYVDDLADACIFLMQNYKENEFINIGTGREVSMRELAEMIKQIVGYKGSIQYDTTKPDGMKRRILDSSKMKKLGWQPAVGLQEGLELAYQWYLEHIFAKEQKIRKEQN